MCHCVVRGGEWKKIVVQTCKPTCQTHIFILMYSSAILFLPSSLQYVTDCHCDCVTSQS